MTVPHTVFYPGQVLAGYDVEEYCPYCEDCIPIKVDYDALDDLEVECPVCHSILMICAMCDVSTCDWREGSGCHMDAAHNCPSHVHEEGN